MHTYKSALAALLAVAALAAPAAARTPGDALAKLTAGRVAGAPANCIQLQGIRSSTIIDRTAIVYEMNNGTRYVNTPPKGASTLNSNYALVTDTRSPQLCSVDIVRLYDSSARMTVGSVGLGKFVPYPASPAKPAAH